MIATMHSPRFMYSTFLILVFSKYGSTTKVSLYDEYNFQGKEITLDVKNDRCVDVPDRYNDQASSLSTQAHCVHIYEHTKCEGNNFCLTADMKAHERLDLINFDNMTSSVKLCTDEEAEICLQRTQAQCPSQPQPTCQIENFDSEELVGRVSTAFFRGLSAMFNRINTCVNEAVSGYSESPFEVEGAASSGGWYVNGGLDMGDWP